MPVWTIHIIVHMYTLLPRLKLIISKGVDLSLQTLYPLLKEEESLIGHWICKPQRQNQERRTDRFIYGIGSETHFPPHNYYQKGTQKKGSLMSSMNISNQNTIKLRQKKLKAID